MMKPCSAEKYKKYEDLRPLYPFWGFEAYNGIDTSVGTHKYIYGDIDYAKFFVDLDEAMFLTGKDYEVLDIRRTYNRPGFREYQVIYIVYGERDPKGAFHSHLQWYEMNKPL